MFLKTGIALADDCKKMSKAEAIDFADIIFIGQVIETTDSTYKIKDIPPSYRGGIDALEHDLNRFFIYPTKIRATVTKVVKVRIEIDADGQTKGGNFENAETDILAAVMNAFGQCRDNWIGAVYKGTKVGSLLYIDVEISHTDLRIKIRR